MMNSLVGVELETGGVLIKFVKTAVETAGALHAQQARYPPHSPRPPVHCHPKQTERFQIMEGSVLFTVSGADRILRAGDELEILPGIYHCAYNPDAVPALVLWETRPALRTAEFFQALGRAGRGRARPPLTEAAAILREYNQEFRPAKPPLWLQPLVFGCLAAFAPR